VYHRQKKKIITTSICSEFSNVITNVAVVYENMNTAKMYLPVFSDNDSITYKRRNTLGDTK